MNLFENIREGRVCELCGEHFQDPEHPYEAFEHGHAVICRECWNDLLPCCRDEFKKAFAETFEHNIKQAL